MRSRYIGEERIMACFVIHVLRELQIHTDRARSRTRERVEQERILIARERPAAVRSNRGIIDGDERDRVRRDALSAEAEPPIQEPVVKGLECTPDGQCGEDHPAAESGGKAKHHMPSRHLKFRQWHAASVSASSTAPRRRPCLRCRAHPRTAKLVASSGTWRS